MRYVALLRGVNVGGNNIIRMAELKACFETELRFGDVRTLIQSGNVIFSGRGGPATLAARIEKGLSARFGYESTVVVLSRDAIAETVNRRPRGFGSKPEQFRYDVIFLKPPLTARQVLRHLDPKAGVDAMWPGKHAVYASRLISRASQSRLSKIATTPMYPSITIRNWNTTTKLLALLGES